MLAHTVVALFLTAALTFSTDIAPIIHARCATCHRPGEIGPFSLLTYNDVKQRLTQIKIVTARRIMPPWKPEPGKGEFEGERRLTDRELSTIQQWIDEGAAEGRPQQSPINPQSAMAVRCPRSDRHDAEAVHRPCRWR